MGPNPNILSDLLTRGAPVHARNHNEHTPLFLASEKQLTANTAKLRMAGAHYAVGIPIMQTH